MLERLGGDGVEPASERGFLAWVTADGLQFTTAVSRDRAAGIARVSWTPEQAEELPRGGAAGSPTSAGAAWSPSGSRPDGELAEVAAGFSLDMAVLERAHGVDAVELALRSAGGAARLDRRPGGPERAAVAVQLRADAAAGDRRAG